MILKVLSATAAETKPVETVDVSGVGQIGEMGTSGLRQTQDKWTEKFTLKFAQGVADYFITQRDLTGKNTVVIGGDPRENNVQRIEWITGVLLANGFNVVTAMEPDGKNPGMASTPALSAMILQHDAVGGFIVTASHNPAEDAGIKINGADGGGVLDAPAKQIFAFQNRVTVVKRVQFSFSDAVQPREFGAIDAREAYVRQLEHFVDFDWMKSALAERSEFKMAFDAKGAAGGPFIGYIMDRLGVSGDRVLLEGCIPDPKLGGPGVHPEPAIQYMMDFIKRVQRESIDFAAAFDGDADRRLSFGAGALGQPAIATSADEFAVLALAIAEHPEWFKQGIDDVFDAPPLGANPSKVVRMGRSIVSAPTIDNCRDALDAAYRTRGFNGVQVIFTPTGFKYINNSCFNWGFEESNGGGVFSNPAKKQGISEKDGIFYSLMMLTLMLRTGKSVERLLNDHWQRFGRTNFARGEISDPKGTKGDEDSLKVRLDGLKAHIGKSFSGYTLQAINKPQFEDPNGKEKPLDMKTWELILAAPGGKEIKVYARFSGTGTGGYCLRLYVHNHTPFDPAHPELIGVNPALEMRRVQSAIEAILSTDEPRIRSKEWTFESENQLAGLIAQETLQREREAAAAQGARLVTTA